MYHVTGASDALEVALFDVMVEARGLFIDVDNTILVAGDNGHRHCQAPVTSANHDSVGDHEGCLRRARPKLRGPHRHLFGKFMEPIRHWRWSEDLPQQQRP